MWQLMLCLLTANIVPAMITALIQNIQELTCLWPSMQVKKNMSLPPVWVKRKGHFCPERGYLQWRSNHKRCGGRGPTTLLCECHRTFNYVDSRTSRIGVPCIIQTQQPILPPTCSEITKITVIMNIPSTMCKALIQSSPTPSIDFMALFLHLPSLYYIQYQLWVVVFNISMVIIDGLSSQWQVCRFLLQNII